MNKLAFGAVYGGAGTGHCTLEVSRPVEMQMPSERTSPSHTVPGEHEHVARPRLRVASRALGSLLLGGVAILGPIVVVRLGLLPMLNTMFQPGPEWLSAMRRGGIVLSALAGYVAYVRWHDRREATELGLRAVPLLLGAVSGAGLVAVPIAVLFALGTYEIVQFRGVSSALLGVAAVIGIAALLEELAYRALLFGVLERAWGTGIALLAQAAVFAVGHLENVENGGIGSVATMLASVTLIGLLWGGVFILARNVWVVAAHHAAWNFTILLSGVPLSGIEDWRALAPIESRYAGSSWMTGGMFGPESSLVVLLSTAVAVVLLLRTAKRRRACLGPQPRPIAGAI